MNKKSELVRLKNILYRDSFGSLNDSYEILKSDIIKLLQSYFDIEEGDVDLIISSDENGEISICLSGKAKRVKGIKILQ